MKLNLPLTVVLSLASFVACLQAADTYNIDPNHSTVGFAVNHMVINTVHGKFDEFTGSVTLDNNALQSGTAAIQTKSINTGIERRDMHLKSPHLFHPATYPTIT